MTSTKTKKSYESLEITSVPKAIEVLDIIKDDTFSYNREIPQEFPFGIWFRGHSNSSYELTPTIFRKKADMFRKQSEDFFEETNIFVHSTLRLPNYQKVYSSTFDWLCLMQHYETPTRILDWSESILVALYFAVKGSVAKEKMGNSISDAEIVVLNANTLNREIRGRDSICSSDSFDVVMRSEMAKNRNLRVLSDLNNITKAMKQEKLTSDDIITRFADLNLAKPVAVFPHRWNERMVFQSSVFTLHGGKIYNAQETIKDDEKIPRPITLEEINQASLERQQPQTLKYYRIPKENKADIEKTLFRLGIHEGSLFPEMDHQSIYLKQQW